MSGVLSSDNKNNTSSSGLSSFTITSVLVLAFFLAALVIYNALQPMKFIGANVSTATYVPGYANDSSEIREKLPGARPVNLPFSPDIQGSLSKTSTYFLEFENPNLQEPVIVFHSIQDSAKVWLNDVLIDEIGEIDVDPGYLTPKNRHLPILVRLPVDLLEHSNKIELHVQSILEAALGKVSLAEYTDVRADMNWYQFWRVNFLWVGISFAVPMAIFFLSIWYFHQQSPQYLWLGIVMLVWPFNTFPMTFNDTPLNKIMTTLIREPSNLFYATALVSFTIIYCRANERVIRLLWSISLTVFALFALFILFPTSFLPEGLGMGVLYGWIVCLGSYSLWLIVVNAYKRRNIRSLLMAISGVVVDTIAFWDILPLVGLADGDPLNYIVQWGIITVLICYASVMSYELALALRTSNRYNIQLSHEVEEQTSRLKKQYEEIVYLEKQRVTSDERSRLISDMHDGTSGQIVSIIAGLKSGQLSNEETIQQLQYCVQDLRLILDSMNEQATDDLASALALFRQRVDPLLVGAGLKTQWQTAHIPDEIRCSPKVLLNVYRILQEALTNVIKHANASEVKISASHIEAEISLTVVDNGIGFLENGGDGAGYGQASMKKRAFEIGGQLEFKNGDSSGVKLVLTFTRS